MGQWKPFRREKHCQFGWSSAAGVGWPASRPRVGDAWFRDILCGVDSEGQLDCFRSAHGPRNEILITILIYQKPNGNIGVITNEASLQIEAIKTRSWGGALRCGRNYLLDIIQKPEHQNS